MKPVEQLTGRELDAAVAEEVMGLRVVHHAWPQGWPPESCEPAAKNFCTAHEAQTLIAETGRWYTERGPIHVPIREDGTEYGEWPPAKWDGWKIEGSDYEDPNTEYHCYVHVVPHYSTDIAAAWEVVEKTDVLFGAALDESVRGGKPYWRIRDYVWDKQSRSKFQTDGEGDTAPEAICRAALKAARNNA